MSKLSQIERYQFEIQNPDKNFYGQKRLQVTIHPEETIEYLTARLLSFCHCGSGNHEFSLGLYDAGSPTIIEKDAIDETLLACYVGCPDKKQLKSSLRDNERCQTSCYFYQEEDLNKFCHHLRGSKDNWISNVRFFQIEHDFIHDLLEIHEHKKWSITFVDGTAYVSLGKKEIQGEVKEIDIWQSFQESIGQ